MSAISHQAEHHLTVSETLEKVAALLEAHGFKISSRSDVTIRARRGFFFSLAGREREWRSFPLSLTLQAKAGDGRTLLQAKGACYMSAPWAGRQGRVVREIQGETIRAIAALDEFGLAAADVKRPVAFAKWAGGGMSSRIYFLVEAAALVSLLLPVTYGFYWYKETRAVLARQALVERLHTVLFTLHNQSGKAGLMAALPTLRDKAASLPAYRDPMELIMWQEGRAEARLLWTEKGDISFHPASGALPDAVVATALNRAMRKGNAGFLDFLHFAVRPGQGILVEGPEIVQEEVRQEIPWTAVYALKRNKEGLGFSGASLAAPRAVLDTWYETNGFDTAATSALVACSFGFILFSSFLTIPVWIFANRLSRPILRIRDAMEVIARGDFSMRLQTKRSDEIGQLERSVNQAAAELQHREAVKDLFGKYLSHQVVEQVLANREASLTTGTEKEVSVLFADIRGFTRYAESHPAAHVVKSLNEYFGVVVEVIARHEGVLDKYLGDGLMAMFGAPHHQPDHAAQAVLTALEMQAALQSLNLQRVQRGEEPIDIGIGVNSGMVIVGNIGSSQRMEFTAIGDAANLAARLEHRAAKGEVLIGRQTFDKVKELIESESLGRVEIKGKQEPVEIWMVKGWKRFTGPARVKTSV